MGTPRGLAKEFASSARDAGHDVEVVSLQKVEANGCLGCNACRYGELCVPVGGRPRRHER